jgi:hypothetical protein
VSEYNEDTDKLRGALYSLYSRDADLQAVKAALVTVIELMVKAR